MFKINKSDKLDDELEEFFNYIRKEKEEIEREQENNRKEFM